MSRTVFEKIIGREIPATLVYEDDLVAAFRDTNPPWVLSRGGVESCKCGT